LITAIAPKAEKPTGVSGAAAEALFKIPGTHEFKKARIQ
jgi:hypothetical protein